MNFKPILFSTEMIQAILSGKKTQTRRIIKPQPNFDSAWKNLSEIGGHVAEVFMNEKKPGLEIPEIVLDDYWLGVKSEDGLGTGVCVPNVAVYCHKGDVLWVRETYQVDLPFSTFCYKADGVSNIRNKWKPSIFMPKKACRIFLHVKNIRVERLQDISEADAIAEGASVGRFLGLGQIGGSFREGYFELWERINGKGSVLENPFVWVVDFEEIYKPETFI